MSDTKAMRARQREEQALRAKIRAHVIELEFGSDAGGLPGETILKTLTDKKLSFFLENNKKVHVDLGAEHEDADRPDGIG